jgi:hypothetical protein
MSKIGLGMFTLLICSVLLIGCEGETGPQGPVGPPGPGSRVVYSGIVTSEAASGGQVILVPDLDLTDFPLVGVYVADGTGDWVQLNLVIYDPGAGTYAIFESAILSDGSILLFSDMVGQQYRIVIVY